MRETRGLYQGSGQRVRRWKFGSFGSGFLRSLFFVCPNASLGKVSEGPGSYAQGHTAGQAIPKASLSRPNMALYSPKCSLTGAPKHVGARLTLQPSTPTLRLHELISFQVLGPILYYTILYYTILYSTILYSTLLYYTILYYTILYYTVLYHTIPYHTIPHLLLYDISWRRS